MIVKCATTFSFLVLAFACSSSELLAFHNVACQGDYQHHLQGVCTNEKDAIYWSFTTELVKTDRQGEVLKKIPVANHHGDLCFYKGRIYVAVNLGKFNDPKGDADSWVYVYDAETLKLASKHETQEVFHGAGGVGVVNGRFYVVGGLPDGVQENYVYEYDGKFKFVKKHVVKSNWTHLGIQTATFHDGAWWFGCYGSPKILLKTNAQFKMLGRYEFDSSLGIVGVEKNRLLVAKGPRTKGGRCLGSLHLARPDQKHGLAELPVDSRRKVTIVTLGDSITKGVRSGVAKEQTFASLLQTPLTNSGAAVRVVNVGVGGERTDQALRRLDKIIALKPDIVTVMYGTNDSYVDPGKKASRISLDAYRGNLEKIVSELLRRGIQPVLMTEPRWADDARPNGLGENPNVRLELYAAACREIAKTRRAPLVDHFSQWTESRKQGVQLRDWTTDGCHPNPAGHRQMAAAILPVIRRAIAGSANGVRGKD